jgi:acetolactate synthase-1/2/3 large subunit
VATTLQGKSSFPAKHPLHTGVGFGPSSVPAAENTFSRCDCLLAVGVRFSELATGSYGFTVPENLIHIDINPDVFDQNYPTKVAIQGDAREILSRILKELRGRTIHSKTEGPEQSIGKDKIRYFNEWKTDPNPVLVSPGLFFQSLKEKVEDDAIMVVDDGKHTFLASELFPVNHPRHFISPTDFNCMGYCVPAAIGAKLGNPAKQVVGIVGDGAFMMTGMELITAVTHGLGIMIFVFYDGELGQISQFQTIPLNRKTATVIGDLKVEGVAMATGTEFLSLENDNQIAEIIDRAIQISNDGTLVLVDVKIDYSKKTRMTKGVLKTNLGRFPLVEKIRFISRAIKRHVLG